LAVLVGLLAWVAASNPWMLVFIVGLLVCVFLHEMGHFATARLTGMKVTQFFMGFGPRLWSRQRGELEYGVRALPLGAFVRIVGMNNLDDCPPEDEPRAYRSKSYPRRMLVIANNLGVLPKYFFPTGAGKNWVASPYLSILEEIRPEFTVFTGLSHPGVTGGHSTDNCFLTAARGAFKSGFRNSISLDQFAAEKLGQVTRFPSLNLGVNIDKGNRSLSWTRDGVLLPAEDSAPKLYERMFVQGDPEAVARQLHRLESRGVSWTRCWTRRSVFRVSWAARTRRGWSSM
jgi:hypothetical protein